MAQITIRRLPETTKTQIRVRAAEAGRSMESEARLALIQTFGGNPKKHALEDIRDYIRRTWKVRRPTSMVDDLLAERRREAKREAERGW